MKYKVFVIVYICLVLVFITVNELVFEFPGAIKTVIVAAFLFVAFLSRHILKDRH